MHFYFWSVRFKESTSKLISHTIMMVKAMNSFKKNMEISPSQLKRETTRDLMLFQIDIQLTQMMLLWTTSSRKDMPSPEKTEPPTKSRLTAVATAIAASARLKPTSGNSQKTVDVIAVAAKWTDRRQRRALNSGSIEKEHWLVPEKSFREIFILLERSSKSILISISERLGITMMFLEKESLRSSKCLAFTRGFSKTTQCKFNEEIII